MKIEHFYEDGRKWVFGGGDALVRVISPDYSFQGTWIIPAGNQVVIDYWTQQPTGYRDFRHILASH